MLLCCEFSYPLESKGFSELSTKSNFHNKLNGLQGFYKYVERDSQHKFGSHGHVWCCRLGQKQTSVRPTKAKHSFFLRDCRYVQHTQLSGPCGLKRTLRPCLHITDAVPTTLFLYSITWMGRTRDKAREKTTTTEEKPKQIKEHLQHNHTRTINAQILESLKSHED